MKIALFAQLHINHLQNFVGVALQATLTPYDIHIHLTFEFSPVPETVAEA